MKQLRWGTWMFLYLAYGWTWTTAADALADGLYAQIDTPRGVMIAELRPEKAPLTVTNFVGLAEGALSPKRGLPFFDGLTFHRVVPGFVIQGGDPLGTGEGGPNYTFADEFSRDLHHDRIGVLSMANDGPDTNGSQFFITLAPVNRLNYLHSVFGQVIQGLEVLPRIRAGDTMTVKILRVGQAARAFPADLSAFHRLVESHPRTPIKAAAKVPHFADEANLLPTDPPRAKTFDLKLINFERSTGHRIYARVYARFSPGEATPTRESYADAVAKELGLHDKAALALFFADEGKGYLSMQRENLVRLLDRVPGDALSEKKQRFAEATERLAAETIAELSHADTPLTEPHKFKLKIDAFLDGLIALFEAES